MDKNTRLDIFSKQIQKKSLQKTTLDDYKVATPQEVETSKPQKEKLLRKTVYLKEEHWKKLHEIYAKRILKGMKSNQYDLITEALEMFFEKEGS